MKYLIDINIICMFATAKTSSLCCIKSAVFYIYDKGVVSIDSKCSALGGLRKPDRATLFLYLIVVFLLMRRPVKTNCDQVNNSSLITTTSGATSAISIVSEIIFSDDPENLIEVLQKVTTYFLAYNTMRSPEETEDVLFFQEVITKSLNAMKPLNNRRN